MSSNTLSTTPFFTPTSVSGCALWLDGADASTLVLSGSNVTQWNDKSGNGYNTSNLTGTPTYSSNGINFSGTQAMGTNLGYAVSLSNHSMFAVISYTSGFNGAFIETNNTLGNNGSGIDFFVTGGQQRVNGWSTGLIVNGATELSLNTINLHGFTFATGSSGSAYIYLDGRQTGSNTSINFTFTAGGLFSLGNWKNGASYGTFFTGQINETVVYSNVLSTAQRQQVEGYLAWKWGLQSNLPSSHPYRYAPQGVYQIPPNIRPTAAIPIGSIDFFSPTSIAGCRLWFDANDSKTLILSGSSITTWQDKSGNGYNATGVNNPTYSNGTVNFLRSSSQYFTLPNNALPSGNSAYSYFAICNFTSTANRLGIIGGGTYGNVGQVFALRTEAANINAIVTYWWGNDFSTPANVWTVNSNTLVESFYSPSAFLNTWVNAVQRATGSLSTRSQSTTGNTIGSTNNGTELMDGSISEIIVYSNAVTTAQRQQVEGYLAWKWGIQASLPASHPFRNASPGLPIASVPLTRQIASGIFIPLRISGCALWLDAADTTTVILNGTNASQWNDKSGNGYNLSQANASLQPAFVTNQLNGFGGIQPSAGRYLALVGTSMPNFAYGNQTSVFCVARNAANNSSWNIFATMFFTTIPSETTKSRWHLSFNQGATAGFTLVFTNNPQTIYQNTSFVTQPSAPAILGFTGSSSETLLAYNGLTSTYAGRTLQNADDGIVMAIADPRASPPVGGTVFELIGFNRAITPSERQQIEGYLAWKWGLVGSLPVTHPYKKWPPPP